MLECACGMVMQRANLLSSCLFECQGGDLGLAVPAAQEGVNRLHICSPKGL